jgi:phage gp46-like protein
MSLLRIKQNAGGCGFDLVRDPDTGRIQLSGTEQQRQTSLTIMSVFSNRLAEGGDELPAGTTDRRGYWGDYLLPRIVGSEDRLGS